MNQRSRAMNTRELTKKILENWPAKIFSFVLALMLFLFYRMSSLEERFFSVPLEIETNGEFIPSTSIPRTVKITLKGESEHIYPIVEQDIIAYLDLARISSEGEYKINIKTRLSGTALGVTPLEISIDPEILIVKLEKKEFKTVSITPSLNGYPDLGYELHGVSVTPEKLEISGPQNAVSNIDSLFTETINLTGKKQSFGGEISLIQNNSFVEITGQKKVTYNVYIEKSLEIKKIDKVPFYFKDLASNLYIEPSSIGGSIRISGLQYEFETWSIPNNILTIDCRAIIEPGLYELEVQARVPNSFEVLSYSPKTLQIEVKEKEE